jgi:hypothetical protein
MQEGALDYLLFDQEKASGIPWPRSDVRRFFTSAHDNVVESTLLFTKISTEVQSGTRGEEKDENETRTRSIQGASQLLHNSAARKTDRLFSDAEYRR